MIRKLSVKSHEIFLENSNKIIVSNFKKYYEFIRELSIASNEKTADNVLLNDKELNEKNLMFLDLSNINGLINLENNEKIENTYLKYRIQKFENREKIEEEISEILENELNLFMINNNLEFEVNLEKILKSTLNFKFESINDKFYILNELIKEADKTFYIIIYSPATYTFLKDTILNNESENLILLEVCNSDLEININDNILIFDNDIIQITESELENLVIRNAYNVDINVDREAVIEFMRKRFFSVINNSILEKECELNCFKILRQILTNDLKINGFIV